MGAVHCKSLCRLWQDDISRVGTEQTANLTSYQLNLIRAICEGYHQDFGSKEVTSRFELGTKSNLTKLKKALVEREIIEITETGGCYIADPLFEHWFKAEMR